MSLEEEMNLYEKHVMKSIYDKDATGYDYYYQQRLKWKDSEQLKKYIELSKLFDKYKSDWEPKCFDPERLVFTVYVSTNYSFQGKSDFDSFDFVFFPEYIHQGFSEANFFEQIFEGCVREGIRQKSNSLAAFVRNL